MLKRSGLVASWTVIVMVSLLMLASSGSTSDRFITTGANQTTSAALPGGGTVALGARSTLKLGVTERHWVGRLVEGEAILRKGIPYRVPVDMRGAMVASCCGGVTAKPVGG